MKVRGTSEFFVSTPLHGVEMRAVLQRSLDDFRATHPEVLSADVTVADDKREIQVQLVFSAASYGAAEDTMIDLAPLLAAAVSGDSTTTAVLTTGAMELAPA